MLVVIGTDCTGSCKSNYMYHTIMFIRYLKKKKINLCLFYFDILNNYISLTLTEKLVLESLNLSHLDEESTDQSTGDRVVLPCLFCNKSFDDKDDVQRHIVTEHKLVIADVNLISQFQRYMKGNFLSL